MPDRDKVAQDPHAAFFDTLKDVRAGMLGLTAAGDGFQPMTHFPDAEAGLIWLVSSSDTDLVQSLGLGEDATYVVVGKDHGTHAWVSGKLYHVQDEAKLDEVWSPVVAAWFAEGRHDPKIALLRFEPTDGQIWGSSTSALKFGFEILRASMAKDHHPDVGTTARITFAAAR